MNPIEIYYHLNSLSFDYDINDTKELSFITTKDLNGFLVEHNIDFEDRNGKIFIKKVNLPFSYFQNKLEFNDQIILSHFSKPIIIQDYNNENDSRYFANNIESNNVKRLDPNDFFVQNAKTYLISKDFFRDQYNKNDESFEFVDFYSDSNKTITFTSISEKRRIKFNFSATGSIELDSKINLELIFNEFQILFEENKQYPIFLKKALIRILLKEKNSKYESFFKKLTEIILEAKLNFNVYLHELSIDKIKAEYKEYKQKYFSSQNEILNKLTTQIVALPISISGTVFAIWKFDKEIIPVLIVCFGLICYIGYVTFLIKIYIRDIKSLHKQSIHDYSYLSEQTFFIHNKGELLYFQDIKTSISNRLSDLFRGLKLFTLIMWISSGLIMVYLISNLTDIKDPIQIILISILLSIILGFIHSFFLFKEKLISEVR